MIWQVLFSLPLLIHAGRFEEVLNEHKTVPNKEKEHGDPSPIRCPENADCGEPLLLTPMLKTGRIQEAQQAAKVISPNSSEFQLLQLENQQVQSYSGFFTVNETFDSNLFFWFFLAENQPKDAPILLYLEGGPGAASTADAFHEMIGPFLVNDDLQLTLGSTRWTQSMNLLYIDNPVGAGFSFTRNNSGYATTQEDYTTNLYSAVLQFFQLFPDYRTNEFFISGESYGMKYVPALAYEIHRKNPTAQEHINLKGIAICSGMVNPIDEIDYSEFLYGISVIDLATKHKFAQIEGQIKDLIKKEHYKEASIELDQYMHLIPSKRPGAFHEVTGLYPNNYLEPDYSKKKNPYDAASNKLLKAPALRKSLHVGRLDFWDFNPRCYNDLLDDLTRSLARQIEVLMDNYRVLLFNGQLEIICSYRLMVEALMKLTWKDAEEYRNATRHQWWVGDELAGYVKSAGNLIEILVRNASHGCAEQPLWIWELMRRFTWNLPLDMK